MRLLSLRSRSAESSWSGTSGASLCRSWTRTSSLSDSGASACITKETWSAWRRTRTLTLASCVPKCRCSNRNMARRYLETLASDSFRLNQNNILRLVGRKPHRRLCDLGCDDGLWTMDVARAARAEEAYGVEIVHER